jgi:hypothetical protein
MRLHPVLAKDVSRVALVLAPVGRRRRLRALALVAALAGALVLGVVATDLHWRARQAQWQQGAVPLRDLQQVEQALAQLRMQLQVSEAHGRELEQQIDGLHQRLRECVEELTFFRTGRNAKR